MDPPHELFLRRTEIIDWDHPAVIQQAHLLARGDALSTAKTCFEWVRDQVLHSGDHQRNPVTCRASDVLRHRTGYCYAKSHLLAALLRANGIPAGFCYQRLSIDDSGPPYCLHGLNAILLPEHGWYRVDARGNCEGVDAQFTPPVEQLACRPASNGEADFETVLPDPLECVVRCLRSARDWQDVLSHLPDVSLEDAQALGLRIRC